MTMITRTYNQVRPLLQTGDIVGFGGKGWISNIIKLLTGSEWSHVGGVVRIPEIDTVFLYESTTLSKLKDVESGVGKKGVQLVSLRDRINTYRGSVGIRRLVCNRSKLATQLMNEQLKEFMALHRNKPYERNLWQLFCAAYDGLLGRNRADMTSIFCSELWAGLYQKWGILSTKVPANEYTPANWMGEGDLAVDKLLRSGILGEVTTII